MTCEWAKITASFLLSIVHLAVEKILKWCVWDWQLFICLALALSNSKQPWEIDFDWKSIYWFRMKCIFRFVLRIFDLLWWSNDFNRFFFISMFSSKSIDTNDDLRFRFNDAIRNMLHAKTFFAVLCFTLNIWWMYRVSSITLVVHADDLWIVYLINSFEWRFR